MVLTTSPGRSVAPFVFVVFPLCVTETVAVKVAFVVVFELEPPPELPPPELPPHDDFVTFATTSTRFDHHSLGEGQLTGLPLQVSIVVTCTQ